MEEKCTTDGNHRYAEKECPECGHIFCYSCCRDTNVDQGGKYDPDFMDCPNCGADYYAPRTGEAALPRRVQAALTGLERLQAGDGGTIVLLREAYHAGNPSAPAVWVAEAVQICANGDVILGSVYWDFERVPGCDYDAIEDASSLPWDDTWLFSGADPFLADDQVDQEVILDYIRDYRSA
jgi:hypothetical protein